MADIVTTQIQFVNVEELVTMDGNQDAATVRDQFLVFYPYLANCTWTEVIVEGVKTITFAESLGTKG